MAMTYIIPIGILKQIEKINLKDKQSTCGNHKRCSFKWISDDAYNTKILANEAYDRLDDYFTRHSCLLRDVVVTDISSFDKEEHRFVFEFFYMII